MNNIIEELQKQIENYSVKDETVKKLVNLVDLERDIEKIDNII